MSDFERFEPMMLDYAYGLLDAEQVVELEAFLANNPAGSVLREQAEDWKRKLAAAAKAPFPSVQFTQPAPSHAVKPLPANTEYSQPPRLTMKSVWTRWAIAASTLLVICGFGFPAARLYLERIEEAARGEFEGAIRTRRAGTEILRREFQVSPGPSQARHGFRGEGRYRTLEGI